MERDPRRDMAQHLGTARIIRRLIASGDIERIAGPDDILIAHQPGCRQVRHRQGSRSQRRRLRPVATKAAQPTKATLVTAAETAGIKEGDNPHVWFSAKVRSNTADAITAAYQKATRATRTTTPSSTKNGTPRKTSLSPRSRRLPPRPRACRTPPPNPWPGTWPTTSR